MIVGNTQSADGGRRRILIRHTQIVDNKTRSILIAFIDDIVFKKCKEQEWVGARDLFPNIPSDLESTPLSVLWEICKTKFADNPDSWNINVSKYLGMLVRESVYYSKHIYTEQIDGSVRKYRIENQ